MEPNDNGSKKVTEALDILVQLGFPRAQRNERSAWTLLALVGLTPVGSWSEVSAPLLGITPIMAFIREHYGEDYAPNTREKIRRQTVHQFLEAGLIVMNPDDQERPVNSPRSVYQIEAKALDLLRAYGTEEWGRHLASYMAEVGSLSRRYARSREMLQIPVVFPDGQVLHLSPGGQNVLTKSVIEEFCPRFAPGARIVYVGDARRKFLIFDEPYLRGLGVEIDLHGKMPDLVIHRLDKDWLLLIEAVTSHGPVDAKRHAELVRLFERSRAGLVLVTAFLTRRAMARYLAEISWETEVWIAEAPDHLIHFDGERFLGPYAPR